MGYLSLSAKLFAEASLTPATAAATMTSWRFTARLAGQPFMQKLLHWTPPGIREIVKCFHLLPGINATMASFVGFVRLYSLVPLWTSTSTQYCADMQTRSDTAAYLVDVRQQKVLEVLAMSLTVAIYRRSDIIIGMELARICLILFCCFDYHN